MTQNTTQRLFLASLALFALGTIATRASAASGDQAFVDNAFRANTDEIAEARYMLKHSKDAKTRAFAQMMIDDHSTANVQLLSAAREAQVQPPMMLKTVSAPPPPPELAGLAGPALDKAYFTLQVADHRQALTLFSTEASGGTSPALRSYASTTVPIVQKHEDIAEQWVESNGRLPATINAGMAPATSAPANPLMDANGPLQSAAPTVQVSATANPQPTTTSVVATALPTHTPGPP